MDFYESSPDSENECDMARKASGKQVVNAAVVETYVARLKAAGIDHASWDAVVRELLTDKAVKVAEWIGIAWSYGGGGLRPKSRAAAVEKIERRFNELCRKFDNLSIAEKARPW